MKDEVIEAIQQAFISMQEYLQEVTYQHQEIGEYDPDTGGPSVVEITSTFNAVVRGYSDFIVNSSNGNIHASDRKVMLMASDLSLVPSTSDYVSIGGETYSIINVKSDVGGNLWILQARKS